MLFEKNLCTGKSHWDVASCFQGCLGTGKNGAVIYNHLVTSFIPEKLSSYCWREHLYFSIIKDFAELLSPLYSFHSSCSNTRKETDCFILWTYIKKDNAIIWGAFEGIFAQFELCVEQARCLVTKAWGSAVTGKSKAEEFVKRKKP